VSDSAVGNGPPRPTPCSSWHSVRRRWFALRTLSGGTWCPPRLRSRRPSD